MDEKRYNEIERMDSVAFDALTDDEYQEFARMWYDRQTDNSSALVDLQADIEAWQQGYRELWPSGFQYLDEALGGGFMGEQLICLGAISSLGKTSFALQIATQLAEQGKDVLLISLEMSKNELNAKTISRYSFIQTMKEDKFQQEYRMTTQDILLGNIGGVMRGEDLVATDAKGAVYVNAYNATKRIAGNTRIFVGRNDVNVEKVRDLVSKHELFTGRKPFVILDYLQILRESELAKTTEKRLLTDYDITTLKTIARDFTIPVMVISAFNRTSYLEPVSMGSFRESSGIEYSSDILLGMQYHGMDYYKHPFKDPDTDKYMGEVYESTQNHNTRVRDLLDQMNEDGAKGKSLTIELKIMKNRLGKKCSLLYDFYPAYNYYAEGTYHAYTVPDKYKKSLKTENQSAGESSSVVSSGKDDSLGEV